MDIKNLDPKKQYIGIEIGNSLIAKAIQQQTYNISGLAKKDTASHIFAVVYDKGQWNIFESHLSRGGVAKYPASEFVSKSTIKLFEHPLNLNALNYYADLKYPYGLWDIFDKIFSITNDGNGLICSEYISLCMPNFEACRHFNLQANIITPAHIQKYINTILAKSEVAA